MANIDAPKGMVPWRDIKSITTYNIDADASTIQIGDAVVKEADGGINLATAGDDNQIIGSALSYHLTGTAGEIDVCDAPDQEYVMQSQSGDTYAETQDGLNCNLVKGSGTEIYSDDELDLGNAATTSTFQFRVKKMAPIAGNAAGEHAKLIVVLNNPQHPSVNTTGI